MNTFERYLGDTFDLVDVLKSSEQGFVALVYDKHAKRLCAMKERNTKSLEIYKTLKSIDNPHIPDIYRIFERDGKLIVIEEHIDGETLEDMLIYQMKEFTEKFVLDILKQMCNCLSALHEVNIVHRDIKPSNIIIDKNNVVKLIDFGIARTFKPDALSDTEFLGTRGYAAPEQFGLFDFGQTDSRSDIYSLGITMKRLLGDDYKGWLLNVLDHCTALEPQQRYQSIGSLLKDIDKTRKLWLLKKFSIITLIFISAILFTQLIDFTEKTENISPPEVNETETITENVESPKPITDTPKTDENKTSTDLDQDMLNQLINFSKTMPEPQANTQTENLNIPSIPNDINNVQMPSKTPKDENSINLRNGFKAYFYLNGKLMDKYHDIYISDKDNWKTWKQNRYGDFRFPDDWQATLRIVNQSKNDLIDPHVTIEFKNYKYSMDKPTLKAGRSMEINIPLGGRVASRLSGSESLEITIDSKNADIPRLYLIKDFYIINK